MTKKDSDNVIQVKMTGEGIAVDRGVNESTARAILDLILVGRADEGHLAQSPGETPSGEPVVSRGQKPLSLREFFDGAEPKRNPDKIVTIAQYLAQVEKVPDFSRDEIKVRFRNAGESVPGNFPRDFTWTISNGWIAEDPQNAGRFYVTKKGAQAVTGKFSADIRKASYQPKTGKKRSRKAASDATK